MDVVVGGDVILKVGGAVRHQTAVIGNTLRIVLRSAALGEPVLGVTRVWPWIR